MNYQILIGKTVSINDTPITVSKIEKEVGADYITRYRINGGPVYDKIDIGTVVNELEAEVEETEAKKVNTGYFSRFGLFVTKFKHAPETLNHTDNSIFFQRSYGIRKYAYKTVALFAHLRLGHMEYRVELCWNEKYLYNKGSLPETLIDYKRVF